MDFINILLYAIPGLAFLVVIHELGHLLFARWTGIGVEAFAIFFGRPIYSFKWKGIDWRVGWIPFGGYCKMKGQEDFIKAEELKGEADEFYSRPAWARLLTVLGGPIFNILLGLILVTGLFYFNGETIFFNGPIKLKDGYKGLSELRDGDIIVSVDGKSVNEKLYGQEVSTLNMIRKHIVIDGMGNDSYKLGVRRVGEDKVIYINYPFHEGLIKGGELGFSIVGQKGGGEVGGEVGEGGYSVLDKQNTISIGAFSSEDSPGYLGGLKRGDIILSVDGQKVNSIEDISNVLNRGVIKEHKLKILRGGLEGKEEVKIIRPMFLVQLKDIKEGDTVYERGFREGDIISQIDGREIESQTVLNGILSGSESKKTYNIEVLRGIERVELYASGTTLKTFNFAIKQILGVHLINGVHKYYTVLESIPRGIEKTWVFMKLTIVQFSVLPKMEFDTVKDNVAGPIGIFKRLGESAASGFASYMNFVAILSILLGVFNLLPIPAVDGGHVVLTLYEMIKRKPVSLKVVQRFQLIGVFIIISLAVLITINDILKIVRG